MLQVAQMSRNDPANAFMVPISHIPVAPPTGKVSDFGWLYVGWNKLRSENLPDLETVERTLQKWIPDLSELSFDGYVIAGSSVILACSSAEPEKPHDVDFYPVCLEGRDPKSVKEEAMESYQRWLSDFEQVLLHPAAEVKAHENDDLSKTHPFAGEYIVTRTDKCTTIMLDDDGTRSRNHSYDEYRGVLNKFQMIHRAHRSEPGVVVGFDQIACKGLRNKDGVFLTLDAALALYFGINPVDWRRESPSHAHRIAKYKGYGFTPIFPGLPHDLSVPQELDRYPFARGYLQRCLRSKIGKGWDLVFSAPKTEGTQPPKYQDHEDDEKSDYELERCSYMSACYMVVARAVEGKSDLACVIANTPTEIVYEFNHIDVESILIKVAPGNRSDFYFGSDRPGELLEELKKMAIRMCGNGHATARIMSKEEIGRYVEVQAELSEMVKKRTAELMAVLEPVTSKLDQIEFMISNPGTQYTASFHPIFRKHPRDYFGEAYVDFDTFILKDVKRCLLCLRSIPRRGEDGKLLCPLYGADPNILRYIFRHLDQSYGKTFMAVEGLPKLWLKVDSPPPIEDIDDLNFSISASFK